MSEIHKNLIANFFGRTWGILLSIFFVPIYVKYLGLDGYGLFGWYMTMSAMLAPFDFGLGATMKREMARMMATNEPPIEIAKFAKTLEYFFWILALFIGIFFFSTSHLISSFWIYSAKFSTETLCRLVVLMGLALAFQWLSSFYSLALIGLQKMVEQNLIVIIFGTVSSIGSVFLLSFISKSTEIYFQWIIIINLLQTAALRAVMWKKIPKFQGKAQFDWQILYKIRKYAIGISSISVTVLLLTNLDRLILSKILSMQQFGSYILATTPSRLISLISIPIFFTYLPSLSQQVALQNENQLKKLYHQGCQILSVFIITFGLILIIFTHEIFHLWIGTEIITPRLCLIAKIYAFGSLLNGLMIMPYALQLAYGWTNLPFYQNIIAIFIFIPLLILMTSSIGALGAAILWLILNLGYLFITIPVMHKKILKEEKWSWYRDDIAIPFFAALCTILVLHASTLNVQRTWIQVIKLSGVACLCLMTTACSIKKFRELISERFDHLAKKFLKTIGNQTGSDR